jgi:hypothetical protein
MPHLRQGDAMNLLNLFRGRHSGPRSSRTTAHSTVRLRVETLEGRELPSISPLNPAAVFQNAIFRPPVYSGPNFQGLSFDLQSANGKPAHTLTIQTQTNGFFYTAYITGTWQGDGAAKPITGTIVDINGNITITVSWANGQGGSNTLSGSITWVPELAFYQSHWLLQGSVTVTNSYGQIVQGAGPGNVSGNAYPYSLIIYSLNNAYAP